MLPELAYPTYEVGARLAGARAVATDSLTARRARAPAAGLAQLARQPDRPGAARRPPAQGRRLGRERGALVVSDECYLECAWEAEPVSVLHPDVSGGSHDRILAVHSLSKRSNLAGYRARSSPATRRWSASCSRCASTSG